MADNITLTDYYGDGKVLAAKDSASALYMRHAFSVWTGSVFTDLTYGRAAATASLPVALDSDALVTEDAAAAANPLGIMLVARRKDSLSSGEVSADGDVIAANATAKGQIHVYAEVGSTALPTGAATEATLAGVLTITDFDTKVGSLTETAPATDTASSGLNGRLQRIAQRITALIALVPSALSALSNFKVSLADLAGTATDTNSGSKSAGTLRVVIATDQPTLTNAQPVSASALPLPSGAATEATLSTLNGKVTACNTGAVTVSAALPAGANAIGKLAANSGVTIGAVEIAAAQTLATVTTVGTVTTVTNISGTVSLPTGASTAANQATELASLASIVTLLTVPGAVTDRSGSIAAGATAQTLATSNAARRYLVIQNLATETLWVNFGVTAVADQPSIALRACAVAGDGSGGSITYDAGFAPPSLVSIIGATTGSKYAAKEA